MKGEQLNLFDQPKRKAMAEIIVFPVDQEVAFIRETARILALKQGLSADRFWQMTCRRLYARLQVSGLEHEVIKVEVSRFAHAVYSQIELHKTGNPKGAA
ncbi:DUF6074 family protein [Agrobacterium fabrum]|uniref:DUF6074 family protein n=1 Tax=Agrobacterium fabrum TaxID=1176649 RepID=UPI001E607170|nr:DUF6074 family protein [Agrobacterium fabrum]